ncbi:MAG: energy transducer TonB, partial [Candidatus Eremiobacteraeota bacterium]|nr:energy transducer TonB [Candidatus Eremiobacteraeota bacterium]
PAYALGPVISTGTCDVADSPAKMTRAFPVEWPEVAAAQGILEGEAIVMINLDSSGTLTGARLQDSSGNPLLDDEALVAIRNSTYAPEVQHCNRVARDYYIKVIFE